MTATDDAINWCDDCANGLGSCQNLETGAVTYLCDFAPGRERREPIIAPVAPPCHATCIHVPRERFLLIPAAVAHAAMDAAIYGLEPGRPASVALAIDHATRVLRLVTGDEAERRDTEEDTLTYQEDFPLYLVVDGVPFANWAIGFLRPLAIPRHPEIVAIMSGSEPLDGSDAGRDALSDLRAILGLPDDFGGWGELTCNGTTAYGSLADVDPAVLDAWVARHQPAPGEPWYDHAFLTRDYAMSVCLGYLVGGSCYDSGCRYRFIIEGNNDAYERIRAACASAPGTTVAVERREGIYSDPHNPIRMPPVEGA